MHRAAHQLFDQPRLYSDPLAVVLVGPAAERELRRRRARQAQSGARSMRAFIVARNRFAEDCVRAAAAQGTAQCVLLGAGLDTLAPRLGPELRAITFFEVDHPDTQAWKKQRLDDTRLPVPPNLRYVPLDFELEEIRDGLQRANFRTGAPAIFIWLGVVPYLSRDAIMRTLEFAARTKGNEIIFDYAEPMLSGEGAARAAFDELSNRVADVGEPFQSFFERDDIRRELCNQGFADCEDWDAAKLNIRYFDARPDGLRLGTRGHIMHARV
jgi:methyltransferase (TIGR00027 family)